MADSGRVFYDGVKKSCYFISMIQLNSYSDSRFDGFCIYCGGPPETVDHIPSKVLMDKPYPTNLMAVDCCLPCNNEFSADEEYFACLIECVLAGTTEVEKLKRENIRRALTRNQKLRKRLESARSEINGQVYFQPEEIPVKRALMKLACAHAKYEHSEPKVEEPVYFSVSTLHVMTEDQKNAFFSSRSESPFSGWPEVGSRGMQRMAFTFGSYATGYPWVTVQDGNYEFAVAEDVWNPRVRILIRNYLAVEVGWE